MGMQLHKNRIVGVLLVLQAVVYITFLVADCFFAGLGLFSTFTKYLGILLCLAIAMLLRRGAWSKRDSVLLISALFFTSIADLFLLLLNRPITGLLFFCVVHLVYIRRYRPRLFYPAAAAALAVMVGCLAAGRLVPGFPIAQVMACLYCVLIATVTVCGFLSPLPRTNRRLVNTGMVLFLLCDVHVALFNVLDASNPYFPFAAFFMWFFYLPSQVALALSGYCYEVS